MAPYVGCPELPEKEGPVKSVRATHGVPRDHGRLRCSSKVFISHGSSCELLTPSCFKNQKENGAMHRSFNPKWQRVHIHSMSDIRRHLGFRLVLQLSFLAQVIYIYIYMVPPLYLHMLLSNGTWTLTTLVLTRKTMNNYALTTKILQQATKQEQDF